MSGFNSDCVYYDKDMRLLIKEFESLKNHFDDIRLRFDRRDTICVSPSVFNYYEKSVLKGRNPDYFYSYRNGDIVVSITCKRKGLYDVVVYNFDINDSRFILKESAYDITYSLNECTSCLDVAIGIFNDVTSKVIKGLNNELY